jgi:hypothetical protein
LLLNPYILCSTQFPNFVLLATHEVLPSYIKHCPVVHINFDSVGRKTWRWDALNLNGSTYILDVLPSYFTILFCYRCSSNFWTPLNFHILVEILMIMFYFQANKTRMLSSITLSIYSRGAWLKSLPGQQLFWLRFFVTLVSPFRKVLG